MKLAAPTERDLKRNVQTCFQCRKCSGGCPLAPEMDVMPHAVIRMLQTGMRAEALRTGTIWLCASCQTCTTRCPNGIDIARVMDELREDALRTGVKIRHRGIVKFHSSFLAGMRPFGRQFELAFIGLYKLVSGKFFSDLLFGAKLFLRGKLKLLPRKIRGRDQIREFFKRYG